jgi:DNA-directed RNA polymerase specialized sigma24 family protein
MGAVSVQVYNVQLMAIAKYNDVKTLKKLYKNYYNLKALAQEGDTVAMSIFIDLKTALSPEANVLTDNQRKCIVGHLLEKSTLRELAEDFHRNESTILEAVNSGLKRIQRSLAEGGLY